MDKLICTVLLVLCQVNACFCQTEPVNCQSGKYPPPASTKVGWYNINLDLPPEQRWNELGKAKGQGIRKLIEGFKDFIKEFGTVGEKLIQFVDNEGGKLLDTLPYPFAGEIRGFANATGVKLGEMVLYNVFYELFSVCTSIVAEDSNGKLYHGRNLDFGLFLGWDIKNKTWSTTEKLRPIIVNLNWQRGGKTVFKSVNFAGYVGILTAIKPKIFTFSMDERFKLNGGYIGVLEWVLGNHKQQWMGFLSRQVMENTTSYSEAKFKLQNTTLLSPAYFILGGNQSGQACVITRSRTTSDADTWTMPQADKWYILETNYDHWVKPFILDDRRTPAHKCMDKLGQKNAGFAGLFNVLSTQPNLNKLTSYTALMQVDKGTLESYIQYCKDPCSPW